MSFLPGREDNVKMEPPKKIKTKLHDLRPDCLEKIASYLDTRTMLNLLYSNKEVYSKLVGCTFFWKQLCQLEGFDKMNCLTEEKFNKDDENRLTWSGELLHNIETSEEATRWQKIYQRGIQMRKNLAQGKCEMWRLFMVNEDEDIPLRKMTQDTQEEDLEILNNLMPYYDQERPKNVQVNRYWNEEFLVVLIQYDLVRLGWTRRFHDLFVWKWQKCQKPKFLYCRDILFAYPSDLLSECCYIHENYFVLMPDADKYSKKVTSLLRVHDLSDGFKLVGKVDFDEDSNWIRNRPSLGYKWASLNKLGDKAVALCHLNMSLNLFIFSIPDCKLEKSFKIKGNSYDYLALEFCMIKDNTMMFLFSQNILPQGQLLQLNFNDFIQKKGDIKLREYKKFSDAKDPIVEICLNSKTQMTCILRSGVIVIKDLNSRCRWSSTKGNRDLYIREPEPLQRTMLRDKSSLSCSPGGDLIIAKRHFISGRKIHAYNKKGVELYEICVDELKSKLGLRPRDISIDLKGRLLVKLNIYFGKSNNCFFRRFHACL